ncbi:MAG: SDR family NAD(P)-dependent oxidoreductase [Ornithinimicrobium sp.]
MPPTPRPRAPREASPGNVDVDVVVVGAGISGIDVAWRLQEQRPHTSYVILEGRSQVGGTWDLFRYPGIRSDSDIATFAFPFRPWTGETVLAEGPQIKKYVEATADEAGITAHIRFDTTVTSASWSSSQQRWTLTAHSPLGPQTLTCSFLHLAAGYYDYDAGHQPHFPGRDDFSGPFVHPQHWPEGLDVTGQRVVVIGSGATAMTLVPALARTATHVTMLQRTPSWVASMPNRDRLDEKLRRRLPASLAYRLTRTKNIALGQGTYALARRRPTTFAAMLRASLKRDIPDDAYLDAHFTPDYQPWDQRVCRIPNGDLTKAIASGRASVVTAQMESLVPDGVRLADGEVLSADVIVSATGLRLQMLGGITVTVDGEVVDPATRVAYRGLMLERVPNLMFTVGYVNSSWTLRADLVARYLCRLLDLMDRRGYAVAAPSQAPEGERRPLLDLKAGYVMRSLDKLPTLGPRRPWTYAQNYLAEAPELLHGSLRTDMVFTRAPDQGVPMPSPSQRARGRYDVAGGTAVVTGAAGGIGAQLARQLAQRGSHLALIDRRAQELAEHAAGLRRDHPALRISTHVVDLADAEQVEQVAEAVLAEHQRVSLLINNAGVALGGRFDQISAEEFDWLLQINLHAPIALVRAFLPALSAQPGSQIVNMSSLFGLVAPGAQTAYVTSKYALRGFSQALGHDLAQRGIGVTSVHPGGVRTRIALDSRTGTGLEELEAQAGREAFDRLLRIDPADAARTILRATERRRRRVLVGGTAIALDLVERAIPTTGGRLLAAAQQQAEHRAQRRRQGRRRAEHHSPSASTTVSPAAGVSTVDAAGTQVRVRITGPVTADPVLLLHGIGRSLEDWTEQHDLLSEDHRVISLDLPGFGHTPVSAGGMSLSALADAVVATVDALEEHRPVHLVGNSLGGAVAMTLLVRHPHRVRSMALADSAGFGSDVTANLRIVAVPGLGPWLLDHPRRSATAAIERSLYADPSIATQERVDRAMDLARVPGRAQSFREALLGVGGLRGVDAQWRDDLLSRVSAYPVPTLVLWGEQDQVLPAAHLEAASRALPHARAVLLPDTGHLPQVERPEDVAALLTGLWESCVDVEAVPRG